MAQPKKDNPLPPCPKPTFPEQNADGVDLSLILENLRLSPSERLRRADAGRRAALKHMEYARAQQRKNSA